MSRSVFFFVPQLYIICMSLLLVMIYSPYLFDFGSESMFSFTLSSIRIYVSLCLADDTTAPNSFIRDLAHVFHSILPLFIWRKQTKKNIFPSWRHIHSDWCIVIQRNSRARLMENPNDWTSEKCVFLCYKHRQRCRFCVD